jgi:hypothetical protein
MVNLSMLDWLSFAVVNTVNILTLLIFLARVKSPHLTRPLGIAAVAMAIPAIVLARLSFSAGRTWPYYVMPLIFTAWAVFALVFDLIRKTEFRQPRNPKILVPFLLLFYIGLVGMGILTWRIGLVYWLITAITFALQLSGAAYASRHGKG